MDFGPRIFVHHVGNGRQSSGLLVRKKQKTAFRRFLVLNFCGRVQGTPIRTRYGGLSLSRTLTGVWI